MLVCRPSMVDVMFDGSRTDMSKHDDMMEQAVGSTDDDHTTSRHHALFNK